MIKPTSRLRRGFVSVENRQVFAQQPGGGARWHDGNADTSAHEAHHCGELGHRRRMMKSVSRCCSCTVDNSAGAGIREVAKPMKARQFCQRYGRRLAALMSGWCAAG